MRIWRFIVNQFQNKNSSDENKDNGQNNSSDEGQLSSDLSEQQPDNNNDSDSKEQPINQENNFESTVIKAMEACVKKANKMSK